MHIDEFESQFKRALKEPYLFDAVELNKILFVEDSSESEAAQALERVKPLVPQIYQDQEAIWTCLSGKDYSSVRELTQKVEEHKPDLIIVKRGLKTKLEDAVYGLTNYIDTLTQVCSSPVLLLPNSTQELNLSGAVLVETDHLTGDSRLINWGVRFALPDKTLILAHIEDDQIFQYYIDVISKISEIDTELAARRIEEILLKLPSDFITQISATLGERCPNLKPESVVRLGHTLSDFHYLLEQREVSLLVINTKVDEQLAMGGKAYGIAVEFKDSPLLLL